MAIRALRFLVGFMLLATLIFTIIPSILIWVVTGRQYLVEAAEWAATGEIN